MGCLYLSILVMCFARDLQDVIREQTIMSELAEEGEQAYCQPLWGHALAKRVFAKA